jgi:hypothetical protein
MTVEVKECEEIFRLFQKQLEFANGGVHELIGLFKLTVEILACESSSVVADDDTVRVEHGHNLKNSPKKIGNLALFTWL